MKRLAVAAALLPAVALADADDAARRAKAGDFDAEASVACVQIEGQAMGTCTARAARSGGDAAVVVTFANGFRRTLFFADGGFVRGDTTMSGVGTDTEWSLDGGTYRIRVDDQRFEVPESLVTGE